MNLNRACFVMMLFLMQACTSKSTRFKVIVDNVEGLETGSKVFYKDRVVGFVTDMDLFNDSVLVYIDLNKDCNIPKGSSFIIKDPFLGEKGLYIIPSISKIVMTITDTGRGHRDSSKWYSYSSDSTVNRKRNEGIRKMAEGFKEFMEASKDSANRP